MERWRFLANKQCWLLQEQQLQWFILFFREWPIFASLLVQLLAKRSAIEWQQLWRVFGLSVIHQVMQFWKLLLQFFYFRLIILLTFSKKPLRFYYHKRFVLRFQKLLLASVFTVIRSYWSIELHCNLLRRLQLVFVLLIRVGLFLPWLSWVRLEVDQFWFVQVLKKICLLIGQECFCRL